MVRNKVSRFGYYGCENLIKRKLWTVRAANTVWVPFLSGCDAFSMFEFDGGNLFSYVR